jgi:hypothetical protein
LDSDLQNPIEYCISVILKEAKEEHRLVKQVLYAMLSAYTNNPLNLAINSPSGEGKNWVLEKVAEKFPADDVVFLSGMTDKALFHGKGTLVVKNEAGEYVEADTIIEEIDDQIEEKQAEIGRIKDLDLIRAFKGAIEDLNKEKSEIYKNSKKLIDLSHKILIFLDTPRINLLSILMSLLSHDKYEVEYEYVDTNSGIKTYTNILRGWPAVIFAQAIDYSKHERWPELARRFIITNPEMNSKKKYAEAVNLIVDKFTLPDLLYQRTVCSDEEKNKVKDIIKYMSGEIRLISDRIVPGKNSTYAPFSEVLKSTLPKDKSSDMNAGKRFSVFLSLLPMINVSRRPAIRIHTFKNDGPVMLTVPFALFEDLSESIYLMDYANGVQPYLLEWFYNVFLPVYEGRKEVTCKSKMLGSTEQIVYESRIALTSRELIEATAVKKGRVCTSKQLLETYLYPLMNQGYIDFVNSELDHRANIYFPVIISKYIKLFENDEKSNLSQIDRIYVRDITIFPDKMYLISKIKEVLKYYFEGNISTNLCDHEGKEITVEELVARYYSRPEDHFEVPGYHNNNDDSPSDSRKQEPVFKEELQNE